MSSILSLHGRGLTLDTRADMEPWIKDIDPTTIVEVHFGGNTFGVDACKALAQFLQKATNLKVANFADIFTHRVISEIPLALTAICDALVDKASLVEINLSDNAFGGRSVAPIVPLLTHNRNFQILKLNNNGLGPEGGAVIADALLSSALLSKAEGKPSNLRTVVCGRNRLEDGSAGNWAEAFAAHGGLVEIRMPQNGIRMEGAKKLAEGLTECKGLQYIDLQDNTFTFGGDDAGVEVWAEALSSWPDLLTLNLSDCCLSTTPGKVPRLIETLAGGSNPKLEQLHLQNNDLDTQTYDLLAGVISTHLVNLKILELQWNEVDDAEEVLKALGDALVAQGGKLVIEDEDEESSEENEEQEEEEDEEGEKAAVEMEAKDKEAGVREEKEIDEIDALTKRLGATLVL